MRPFHRYLKLENWCRNKEMASYFAKMIFFKDQQEDTEQIQEQKNVVIARKPMVQLVSLPNSDF